MKSCLKSFDKQKIINFNSIKTTTKSTKSNDNPSNLDNEKNKQFFRDKVLIVAIYYVVSKFIISHIFILAYFIVIALKTEEKKKVRR